MSTRRETGAAAEAVARSFLEGRGYRIRAANFACAGGELDLVAEQGGQIVFVEVRSHTSDAFGLPRESIGPGKQRRLARAADAYLKRQRLGEVSWRFDVVEVYLDGAGKPQHMELLTDAFTPKGVF